MILSDGYSLTYYRDKNAIVITLPQTMETLISTIGDISDRKLDITTEEEIVILNIVKTVFER